MKKRLHGLVRAVLAISLVITLVVPNMVNVFAANSGWTVADDTEIYWVETDSSQISDTELETQIKLFDSELAEKVTGTALPISYGDLADAGENDIILVLDSSLGIAEQGFKITVSGGSVTVSASDDDGLFYGCRDLIQQLLISKSVSDNEEAPDVLERALSLDNGRKYFSVEWIKEMIRELSWANMNTLVLHFSEEMGLGIESKLYSWLAGRDGTLCTQAEVTADTTVLTQDEVREIVEYAKLYHVEIVPSFDSPGHLNYLVKKFNEQCATQDFTFTYDGKTYTAEAGSEIGNYYHYNGKTSIVQGSRNTSYSRGIDISNEVAVAFVRSLIEEYGTLFRELGCTKFDIGGDELLGWGSAIVSTSTATKWQQLDHWKEYAIERTGNSSAVAYDGFMLYMNDLYDLVTELGYTSVRMWNDDALRSSDTGWNGVVTLNKNIEILFWTTGSNTVWTYLNADYKVHNYLSDYNYYAMTSSYFSDSRSSFAQAYADQIYNEWTPYTYDPDSTTLGTGKNTALGNANVLGSAFAIWCDNPTLRTADEVMEDVLPLIRSHGAKAWDATANASVTYTTFTSNLSKMGDAPAGTVKASEVYVVADLTALEAAVAAYDSYDADGYTEDSFAAYTAAVEAGKTVLAADKPEQAVVDSAVEAINEACAALIVKSAMDTSALDSAVAEFEATDASLYTAESFAAYEKAVNEAKAVAETVGSTQEELEAALENVAAMRECLRSVDTVSDESMISSAKSRSTRVVAGKSVTITIVANRTITGVEIYDDLGNRIDITQFSVARTSTATKCTVTVMFTETDKGKRTYTIYVIDEEGKLSADSKKCSVTCY